MPPVTIFIQNRVTKKFLKTARTWANRPTEARSFPSALSAFYFAAEHRLRDVEVVCFKNDATTARQIVSEQRVKVQTAAPKGSAATIPARYTEWPETLIQHHHHRSY